MCPLKLEAQIEISSIKDIIKWYRNYYKEIYTAKRYIFILYDSTGKLLHTLHPYVIITYK